MIPIEPIGSIRPPAELQREWFEVTLANIGDAVITTDFEGRVTFLNPVAELLTGWKLDEALGKPLASVYRVVNEDGTAPMRDAQGHVSGAVLVLHDSSRRRTAERALRASEERLTAVFAQAALGIAIASLDGKFQEANAKFCSILGYPLAELREHSFLDLTHPDDVDKTRNSVEQLRDGKIESYALDKRYVRKDRTTVWSNTTVTALRNEVGEAMQYIGIIQDITDRKHSEEIMARYAAVIEDSEDAIITKTLEGIITTWNPGAGRLFGYSPQEVIGKPVTVLIPDSHLNEEPSILERLRRGERIEHYETVRRRKDGTLMNVSLTVSPIKNASGRVIGASKIARDITRQKRAEAALHETDQRKDEFLATLAHELRNPLAPIRQATLISMSASASEAQKRWSHEVITRQVRHMSLLLDDLLDISRITRGTLELRAEMTDLSQVIDAAVETSRPTIEAKLHQLSIDLPPEPVRFAADPLRLAQVLSNLLTNAAKYTDPRGTIRVRASADAANVEIAVTDSGIGLTQDALSAVFTMFSQVKSTQDRSEGGLGIGLALSKGVVELHGGTIQARSAGIGQGSEFIVRIPRRVVATPAQKTPSTDSAPPARKRRVLIADDNRDAAESLAMLLEMDGHTVTVVHDGRQALASIEASRPEVALLDIGMPEFDGYEVARRVRGDARNKPMLLIAVTGWGQESDKARASAAGFDLHFTKPAEPTQLLELLRGELPVRRT